MQQLERTLAYHGAPALAGIKSADLIAWGCPQVCASPAFLAYCRELARRGIQLRVLRSGCPRCLLLVYRGRSWSSNWPPPGYPPFWSGRATRSGTVWRPCSRS